MSDTKYLCHNTIKLQSNIQPNFGEILLQKHCILAVKICISKEFFDSVMLYIVRKRNAAQILIKSSYIQISDIRFWLIYPPTPGPSEAGGSILDHLPTPWWQRIAIEQVGQIRFCCQSLFTSGSQIRKRTHVHLQSFCSIIDLIYIAHLTNIHMLISACLSEYHLWFVSETTDT